MASATLAAPAHDPLRATFDSARAGDAAAIEALCAQMRPRLYRVAWAIVRDRDEADDLAQEALIRALARRFLFLGRGSVGGWMTRIVVNLAKNRLRDGRRRSELLGAAAPDEASARGAIARAPPAPDEAALAREHSALLDAAVGQLPERQRDVVRLLVLAQLDVAEVAAALGMSEANVRMTMSLAKRKLSTALGGTP